jgi:serine/threonine-protein kinase
MNDLTSTAPIPVKQSDDLVDPAEQLCRLWKDGKRPELDDFLSRVGPLKPEQLVEVLHVDQRERWQAGEPIPAETYLQKFPAVGENVETALDLIYSEFRFREDRGEQPSADEYLRRFPQYRALLESQLKFYSALVSPPLSTPEAARGRSAGSYTAENRKPGGGLIVPGLAPLPASGHGSGEIQMLLRRRLRVMALIMGCGFTLLMAGLILSILISNTPAPYNSALLAIECPTLAVIAVLAGILWSKRPFSLRILRLIELLLVASVMAINLWVTYRIVGFALPQVLDVGDMGDMLVVGLAEAVSLWWATTMIGYGAFIPNTWRRCIAVVGVIGLTPIVCTGVVGFWTSAVPVNELMYFLSTLGPWMAIAGALAVYGAHRIEVLRREAFEARRLGQYQLKQRLGAGGMGEVYLAEHVFLRRPCAIKLIRPERAGDPANLARFGREVQLTATLTHPNTVEILDYGRAEDGTFYYVMEYLPGLSLEQLVARAGPLPPERVVHLLRQVCGALEEAHGAGLVHRDIKPSNLLVCERGGRHDVVKLLDFGLVQDHSFKGDEQKLTQEGAIAGTPAYMSPEQAAGRTDLDGRSDIYSLGAVAYFLLVGQPPFVRRTAVETMAAHIYESPVHPGQHADVPADLDAVVLRCLEKDSACRFPDADALEKALAQCACAGQWTRESSAAWWSDPHGVTLPTWRPPESAAART